ncbi:peptidyl-dipeptidase protein [Obelidium mucronatum]|nr:peptidyl-dipeptidase protein [Obelidium mucronatum]
MAKTPEAVTELLERVWTPAKAAANREREMLAEYAKSIGESEVIRPSDWRFYSEKVRAAKFDIDENLVKPYFSLDRMLEALFDVAFQLYGLKFVARPDLKAYHEDVVVYEVHEEVDGQDTIRAIFLHDNFARQYKSGGAWMSEFRSQSRNVDDLDTNVIPIVINNNNFTKAADGEPTLLSFDDCITLFHEFGHGCHGMLSDSKYQRLASTNVLRDFVELPSQLMEHWIRHPQVLSKHARHYQTNEPIPAELLAKLMAARTFQQGFATVEYSVCALIDQALHTLSAKEIATLDLTAFEAAQLAKLEMPEGIVMRHRIPHFTHLFAGSGYAAGYYVYLWAEVLDADAFDAFLEAGDIFDKATAAKARKYIYSSGSTIDHMEGYRAFRGRDPRIEPMLKKKGLLN